MSMKPYRFPWTPVSDQEYVDLLRSWIGFWSRWRVCLILFLFGLLAVVLVLFSQAIPLLIRLVDPANAPPAVAGVFAGLLLGIAFGWMFHGILHSIIFLIGGFRSERLLLKYHERLKLNAFEVQQNLPEC